MGRHKGAGRIRLRLEDFGARKRAMLAESAGEERYRRAAIGRVGLSGGGRAEGDREEDSYRPYRATYSSQQTADKSPLRHI
jgi:hypothetical protein